MISPIDITAKTTSKTTEKVEKILKSSKTASFNNFIKENTENNNTQKVPEDKPTSKLSKLINLKSTLIENNETKKNTNINLNDKQIDIPSMLNENNEITSFKQAQAEFHNILKENKEEGTQPQNKKIKEDKLFTIKFKNFKKVEIQIEGVKVTNSKEINSEKVTIKKEDTKNTVTNFLLSKLNKNTKINTSVVYKEKETKIEKLNNKNEKISSHIKELVSIVSDKKESIKNIKIDNNIQLTNIEKIEYKSTEAKLILIKMNKNELKNKIEENITKIVEHKMSLPLTHINIKLNNNETIHLKFSGTKDKANLDIKTSDKEIAKEISKVKESLSSNIEHNSNIKQIDISIVLDKKDAIEKYLYMINKDEREKNKEQQNKQPQKEVIEEEEIPD